MKVWAEGGIFSVLVKYLLRKKYTTLIIKSHAQFAYTIQECI